MGDKNRKRRKGRTKKGSERRKEGMENRKIVKRGWRRKREDERLEK